MGLRCPNCGTDNLLNAIFCRGCGEKLDLSKMTPEQLLEDEKQKNAKPGATKGQKIFSSIFAGILIVIIVGLLCPAGGSFTAGEAGEQAVKDFAAVQKGAAKKKKKKKRGAENPAEDKAEASSKKSFTFSSQDATSLVSKAMGLPKKSENEKVLPQNFSIDFREGNEMRLVLKCKVFGFLPMDNVLKVNYKCESKGNVTFEVIGAKIGQLPMFGGLKNVVVEKFKPVVDGCSALNKIKSNAKKSTCTSGTITIEI